MVRVGAWKPAVMLSALAIGQMLNGIRHHEMGLDITKGH